MIKLVKLVVIYVVVALVEIGLHWYAAHGGTSIAHGLRNAYFHLDPRNGKPYVAGLLDLDVPAIILGVALGICGAKWSHVNFVFCAVLLSIGVISLYPIYHSFFPGQTINWWAPRENVPVVWTDYLWSIVAGAAFCGVFAYATRLVIEGRQLGKTP